MGWDHDDKIERPLAPAATDPPAPDLGAPTAVERLRWLVDNAEYHKVPGQPAYFVVAADDVAPVLAAYDAQAARLAAVERAARAVVNVDSGSTWAAITDLAVALDAGAVGSGEARDGE